MYILVVYRPSSNSLLQDECLTSFIRDFCVGRKVVILENFNLPSSNRRKENVIGGYVPLDIWFSLIVLAC